MLAARERLFTPERLYATHSLGHGVAHVWNLLYPRDGAVSGIRLIDRDGWRVGRGAADLAYVMAVHWYPERRARPEAPRSRTWLRRTPLVTPRSTCREDAP